MRANRVGSPSCTIVGALLLLAASTAGAARAGTDSWTPFGPYDGNIQAAVASSRGDLYAVTVGGIAEIWQLPAGASVWRWRSNGLGRPLVRALAVHPTRSNQLWAISANSSDVLFRSVDAGASWEQVAPDSTGFDAAGLWMMPAGSFPAVLFADAGSGDARRLMRSADGGLSWRAVPGAIGPVAAAPERRNVVYAAAAGGGAVLRSDDGGVTFRATRPPGVAPQEELRALHVTYGRYPIAFAAFAAAGLFRSVDGSRWERVAAPAGFGYPRAIASDPRDPRVVYTAVDGGIQVSTRSGRAGSFRLQHFPYGGLVPRPTALVVAPAGPLALGGGDLWTRNGARIAETGIVSLGAAGLRFAPTEPSSLVLRTYWGCADPCFRTFLSGDGGATFRRHGAQISPRWFLDVYDVAFDPATATRRLDAFAGFLMLVEPAGSHMMSGPTIFGTRLVEITSGGRLLAGTPLGVAARRDDGGWSVTLPVSTARGSLRVIDLRADRGAPERVVAGALETLTSAPASTDFVAFRSTDAGATWHPLLGGASGVVDVEAVPGRPATLYALVTIAAGTGGTELRRSDDDGRTAVTIHTFAAADSVTDLALDGVTGDLYAASAAGVLHSRDDGATWESTPGSLTTWGPYRQHILHVWAHPTERGHLFAAPADGGLFENRLSD